MGEPLVEWSYGDVDAGFAKAKLVLDETFVTAGMSHHSMEPRSAMAYWENGKCFVYGSTQSQSFVVPGLANLIGITPNELVYIAETCGGGFGSKGTEYPVMAIPAHMSKKIGRPVMLRITRAEEYFFGYARTGFQGRIRMGFDERGRVTAADLYIVQENGATTGFPDWPSSGETVSILYQPRGDALPRHVRHDEHGAALGAARSRPQPDRVGHRAADRQGREAARNRPARDSPLERPAHGREGRRDSRSRHELLSARSVRQGRDAVQLRGAQARSGRRNGTKVTGIGVGQAFHPAGFAGFDGLVRITTDGKLHLHSGVGNLGTYSHTGTSRIAAEVLKANWDNCIVERGDTRKGLPWNIGQFGSNTSFTMARTNFVAATDAVERSSRRSPRWTWAARRPTTTSAASACS